MQGHSIREAAALVVSARRHLMLAPEWGTYCALEQTLFCLLAHGSLLHWRALACEVLQGCCARHVVSSWVSQNAITLRQQRASRSWLASVFLDTGEAM